MGGYKLRRIIEILKDKRGFSVTVGMLGCVLVFALVFSCFLGVTVQMHKINVLDRFADEMAAKAGQQGRCSGSELDTRYNQLVEATGIKPTVEYVTSFYNSSKQLVQYGDAITVNLTLESNLIGFGDYYIPMILKAKSTEQSMQYWK